MGQYFMIANLTKKEYLHPHKLGSGVKLWEITLNKAPRVLPLLLRKSSDSGGGDINKDYKSAGRWAGDKIVVIGDYDKSNLYDKIQKRGWKEISIQTIKDYNDFIKDVPTEKISLKEALEYDKRMKYAQKQFKQTQMKKVS